MPIYEYRCEECRRPVSLLVLTPSTAPAPRCPRCGGASLVRLLSRFSVPKSEEARLDALAASVEGGDVDEADPASMARLMKQMGREFGDELGGDFEEAVDEAMVESTEEAGADGEAGESEFSSGASDAGES